MAGLKRVTEAIRKANAAKRKARPPDPIERLLTALADYRRGERQAEFLAACRDGVPALLDALKQLKSVVHTSAKDTAAAIAERDTALAGQAALREAIATPPKDSSQESWTEWLEMLRSVGDALAAADFLHRHRDALAALRGCVQALRGYLSLCDADNMLVKDLGDYDEKARVALDAARAVEGVT